MSADANKTIVRRFFDEMLTGHDLAVAGELFTDDYVDHDPGNIHGQQMGADGAAREVGMFVTGFPDMRVRVDDIIADVDRVVVRATLTGTHQGEFAGVPPTGASVRVPAIQAFRVRDGKIAEAWLEIDRVGMLQQMGVIPSPGAAA